MIERLEMPMIKCEGNHGRVADGNHTVKACKLLHYVRIPVRVH
jgi:hypothetical protein